MTNGPLLHRCAVNSAPPGARFAAADELVLHVDAYAASASRLDRVELIVGGTVAHTWQPDNGASGCHAGDTEPMTYTISGNTTITVNASTWVAIRAFEAGPHTATWLRYAHTSPWYVDIANKPPQSAAAAKFFVEWLDELIAKMATKKAAAPPSSARYYDDATAVYQRARAVYSNHYAASMTEHGM